jgi:LysM repeat protein
MVIDHGYYDQLADATQIDAKVGHQNAKAAFFLGQVELLGIGAGTSTEGGGAIPAGVAGFTATDSKDAEVIVAQAGDTLATIQARTNAAAGGVLDEATGVPIVPVIPIPVGKRLKVPGIRWIAAVKNNTLASVAAQNEVSIAALAVANGLPANSPGTTPLISPRRILIPIHTVLP